ncbi:MAG TPA: FecR domain-containing protein [Longimicrobiales bacterium]|nr:FecR domain-containing protein [Longimicrobiales bacterium]
MDRQRLNRPDADDPETWKLLGRYVAGECDDLEAARVRRWLANDPATAAFVESLDQWSRDIAADRAAHHVDIDGAFARVSERIRASATARPRPAARVAGNGRIHTRVRTGHALTSMRAAAAIVLLAAGTWLGQLVRQNPAEPTAPAGSYATAVGQLDTLSLPDGTEVVLAPASLLTVAAGYGESARTVELNGVALFRVVHDEARPFSVVASGRVIRDLGTEFTVRAAPDGTVEVSVTEGEVMILSDAAAIQGQSIRAGDRGSVSATGAIQATPGGLRPQDVAWAEGRLVFDDAPLTFVADELRRWYGIELQWSDAATGERRLTATFNGEPIGEVLAVIEAALGATIERRETSAVVRFPETTP